MIDQNETIQLLRAQLQAQTERAEWTGRKENELTQRTMQVELLKGQVTDLTAKLQAQTERAEQAELERNQYEAQDMRNVTAFNHTIKELVSRLEASVTMEQQLFDQAKDTQVVRQQLTEAQAMIGQLKDREALLQKRLLERTDERGQLQDTFAALSEQIGQLAIWIIEHVPGEPSRSEGACEAAIDIMNKQAEEIGRLREALRDCSRILQDPNTTGISDTIWCDDMTTLVEHIEMALARGKEGV